MNEICPICGTRDCKASKIKKNPIPDVEVVWSSMRQYNTAIEKWYSEGYRLLNMQRVGDYDNVYLYFIKDNHEANKIQ